ncbi:LacI family DNA-binding transcriptional regulator [Halalkalibacter sp. APA_J-10(15)]|uniref:LacI family DNA-binding transcriptional regulator n=1 Tax=Halalkalibacter sp. APA_J-10(15) TaxID=2933805 RepID=UPI001FF489E2|nr:LacI family DNA-binding transcriptional regulator [Halalkalibacter sp. APA_J-10(15)]MCK0470868.1 LacI family DNA-binding transcriptional regulator [Halalkalibacter sp. APA_J-10(15)]
MSRLTRNEIFDLQTEARLKRIKNKSIAEALGVSDAAVSQFFNYKSSLREENEKKIKEIIEQFQQYEWRKVPID